MSRAFVKEPEGGPPTDEELNLPPLEGPVLLTPAGFARLEEQLAQAHGDVARLRGSEAPDDKLAFMRALRGLRLLEQQRAAAVVVDPAQHADAEGRSTIAFGARVTVEDEEGRSHCYTLVGEVEADPKHGLINVKSPLAEALLGHKVGDDVVWRRPAGETTLTITAIDYPKG